MLKVKKKIQSLKNKSQDEDLTQLHNEIKNSIKNLFISDQSKKITIRICRTYYKNKKWISKITKRK